MIKGLLGLLLGFIGVIIIGLYLYLFLVATSEPVQYHCDYCRKDISKMIRIHCATCAEFDLCVECFSVGVELKSHKNNHDYRVIDNMHFPLFSRDWGADEEMLLLEGLEVIYFDSLSYLYRDMDMVIGLRSLNMFPLKIWRSVVHILRSTI